jgi:hypothetical protein
MEEVLIVAIRTFFVKEENAIFSGNPVEEKVLAEAENTLGLSFDKDYKQFIINFGGSFIGIPVYGFNNSIMLSSESVVDLTVEFRESYFEEGKFSPIQTGYVISEINGDPVIMQEKGPVIIYYHDNDDFAVLAQTFEELITNEFGKFSS